MSRRMTYLAAKLRGTLPPVSDDLAKVRDCVNEHTAGMPRTPDGKLLRGGLCFCNVPGACVNQKAEAGAPWCECYCHERECLELAE